MAVNVTLIAGYTFGCHSFRHLVGGGLDLLSKDAVREKCYTCVTLNHSTHALGMDEPLLRRIHELLHSDVLDGRVQRPEDDILMAEYETHRARRFGDRRGWRQTERRSPPPRRASVGLVCKSLLGKAHTVMAEGGIAASLANVDRPRQLEGPLRRHHARRPVRQQLADGEDRQGDTERVRGLEALGSAVRQHHRRADPAAELRRTRRSSASRTSATAPDSR